MPISSRRVVALATASAALVLALPSAASAQAARTWVSGLGDDVNPCSRTAPCRTFAGAIGKTATAGSINVLDAGSYGGLVIGKSITIRGRGRTASVLGTNGTNGFTVNAPSTARVHISGIDFKSVSGGDVAIKVLSAARVTITDNDMTDFKVGISVAPVSPATQVTVNRNDLQDNDIGLIAGPGAATNEAVIVTMRRNDITGGTCGVVASSAGVTTGTPSAASSCGTGTTQDASTRLRLFGNGISDANVGVFARGSRAVVDLGDNDITGHGFAGLRRLNPAQIRSFGDNRIVDNGSGSMPPSSTVGKS